MGNGIATARAVQVLFAKLLIRILAQLHRLTFRRRRNSRLLAVLFAVLYLFLSVLANVDQRRVDLLGAMREGCYGK